MVGRGRPGRARAAPRSHRFANGPVRRARHACTGTSSALYRGVLDGLRGRPGRSARRHRHRLLGGRLRPARRRRARCSATRCTTATRRTDGVAERVRRRCSAEELYARTGLQLLPFNTLFQLVAAPGTAAARRRPGRLLLIPDLLAYWLTGEVGAEVTNASTTQLLDAAHAASGPTDLIDAARASDRRCSRRCGEPGDRRRAAAARRRAETGLPAGTGDRRRLARHRLGRRRRARPPTSGSPTSPAAPGRWSASSWTQPVLTEASRRANFTNELGVDGTVRYLRNVMGLWLLQESLRDLGRAPTCADAAAPRAAARAGASRRVVDPDDPAFLPPGDMPARIADACRAHRPAGARRRRPRSSAASWTASRWPTGGRCGEAAASSPAATSTSCTSSAAAPATRCCASSPPTPAGCRCWPARSRPPRSATSWSRPARPASSAATWRRCAAAGAARPSRSCATSRGGDAGRRGGPPQPRGWRG